jgi:hypothetical protein
VSWNTVVKHGGRSVLNRYGSSLHKAIKSIYGKEFERKIPESNMGTLDNTLKSEAQLQRFLTAILKDRNIVRQFEHPKLQNPRTGKQLELDFYVPSLKLAFEFQGEQHYQSLGVGATRTQQQLEEDTTKVEQCKKIGIDVIWIPFWDLTNKG